MADYYEILGVPKDATFDEIRAAFREQAQKWHPDKSDGDTGQFQLLQEAYRTLISPENRKRYDNGEDTSKPVVTIEAKAKERLAMLFQQHMEKCTPDQDILGLMRQNIMQGKVNLDRDERKVKQSLKNLEGLRKRLHYKGDIREGNILLNVINGAIDAGKLNLEQAVKEREIQDLVLKLLEEYVIDLEEQKQQLPQFTSIGGTSWKFP